MKPILLTLCLLALPLAAGGVTYYVDHAATGSNTGTSWANAWTNLNMLSTDLGLVPAGSTVEISKGFYYVPEGVALCYGSDSNNWTTYRISADPSHNGGVTNIGELNLRGFTVLDGALDASYTNSITKNTYTTPLITNNCGWTVDQTTNWTAGQVSRVISFSGGAASGPIIVKWMHTKTTTDDTFLSGAYGAWSYYEFDGTAKRDLWYCWAENGQGINSLGWTGTGYGSFVEHCLFENIRDNVVGGSGPGHEFAWNVIRNRAPGIQHTEADTFQYNGLMQNVRIHHNVIEPADNSLSSWAMRVDASNVFFYNNVIRPADPSHYITGGTYGGNLQYEIDVAVAGVTNIVVTNFWLVNNTFDLAKGGSAAVLSMPARNDNGSTYTRPTILSNGFHILNNLVLDRHEQPDTAWSAFSLADPNGTVYQAWTYGSNDLVLDYNALVTTNQALAHFAGWALAPTNNQLVTLTNAADVSSATGHTNNLSLTSAPLYSPSAYDYRPTNASLQVATSLAAYTNDMPDISLDIYGNERGSLWSLGAVEYAVTTNSGPVLWFTFEPDDGWATNGTVTDRSGNGNKGMRYNSVNGNAWPSLTNSVLGSGAHFKADEWVDGALFNHGDYIVVSQTNCSHPELIWSLSNGTFAVWARCDGSTYDGSQFLSALGSGQYQNSNTWNFGRTGLVLNRWYGGASHQYQAIEFTNLNAVVPYFATSNYVHYAVTFSAASNSVQGYVNGVLVQTNVLDCNAAALEVNTNVPYSPDLSWIAVGCNTHYDAWLEDAGGNYPNNGWLSGDMDDVRIYNRALSGAEVLALYTGTNSPTPAPTPSSAPRKMLLLLGLIDFAPGVPLTQNVALEYAANLTNFTNAGFFRLKFTP